MRRFRISVIFLGSLLLTLIPLSIQAADHAYKPTVLITGANRGMGLEFAKQYAEQGYRVIATARKPEKAEELNALAASNSLVVVEQLDVTDHDRIEELGRQYQDQPIDILVNNAGVSGGYENQVFGSIDYDAFDFAMSVNTYGPLKMAEVFMPHVKASQQKKIVAVSSNLASITNTFGEVYIYRTTKSALNMAFRTLSKDVSQEGVIIGLITPGPTMTDFAAAAQGQSYLKKVPKPPGGIKVFTASESVAGMIENIGELSIETSGSFNGVGGKNVPW